MMDPVEKFGQIQVDHRSITVLEVASRFSDRGVSTSVRSEPVTAVVKGRFEYRFQYLENRLLYRPVDHVWNAEPTLSATWLWQPDTANFARAVALRQQITSQPADHRRGLRFRRFDRLPVDSGCSLVAHHVQQRLRQVGF